MIRLILNLALATVLTLLIVGPGYDALDRAIKPLEHPVHAPSPSALAPPPSAIARYAPPPPSAFRQTLTRPIFFDTRTYPTPQAAVAPAIAPRPSRPARPPPPPPKQPRVYGIRIDADGRLALIETTPRGAAEWVGVGATVSGWAIERIEQDRVTLRHGDTSAVVKLYDEPPRN